ncbi:MAG: hypothetical protein WAW88_05265 [Nocardioides sp.]
MKTLAARLTRLAVAGLTAGLVLSTAPAHADKYAAPDASADVWSFGLEGGPMPAPLRVVGDIIKSAVIHKRTRVVMKIRTYDLDTSRNTTFGGQLKTNGGRLYDVYANTAKLKVRVELKGRAVKCAGMEAQFNEATHLAKISIPRRCLKDPRWVRAGFAVGILDPTTATGYLDDGLQVGIKSFENDLKMGPRVRR